METPSKTPHLKSRNGCLRCKSKKTKCDERKPACARCEDRGFQCPGYALNVRWSQKHQTRAEKSAAKQPDQSPREVVDLSPPSVELEADEIVVTPSATPASEEVQHVDSWLTPPSQWDLLMPQDLFGLDDTGQSLMSAQSPIPSDLALWGSTSIETAWGVAGINSATAICTEERQSGQKRPLDDTGSSTPASDPCTKQRRRLEAQPEPIATESNSGVLVEFNNHPFIDPPRELFNLPTALSEYFFREVITLYCTWDSKSNAMRNIVENQWQSSGVLHHTIQSMAASCLSEDFPRLSSVAKSEHSLALQYIQTKSPSPNLHEDTLLAYMLLGHTASWLNPQNLATDMFRASCGMLNDASTEADDSNHLAFFSDTMDYWAMLLVYLTDSHNLGDYRRRSVGPADPTKAIEPHPYSGISRETVRMLTDTGILIFQYRKHMSGVKFMTEKDLDVFRVALREARRLERSLLAHRAPDVSHIKDPGDPKTPLNHLQLIDEAYRCTGLLQIYRVFPDLLNERYAPWNKEHVLRPPPATKIPTAQERQTWLTKLAMHVLSILREIPFESRTRSVQPFIMVAVSGELRQDPKHTQTPDSGEEELGVLHIDQASIEVVRARKFVGSRLAAYTHILPLRKIRVIFELINCVWSALDAGEEDVYWLDVAHERNLGTLMG
ncbi:fungal-specific transcription factor domain-containing protein [Thelonectria olida]|uniref:Fungal-specific transcription factor domain-containing protein n=1 Tax=Thelonectria olida TaxID=1576542 RepID=A0A9P8VUL6_9HYPO|nr:fungal-specific transcription factor domain-containing protein [Thelonectria olida]